jgi:uncharacterized protein YkwD
VKRIFLTLVGTLLLSASLHTAAPAEAADCPDADLMPDQITVPRFNAATLCLLNQERTSRGLGALTENAQLDSAALVHSDEMRRVGFFAHESPDGSPFQYRILNTGYLIGASGWAIGENIAWGSLVRGTPRAINTDWMNSLHHRDNILEPGYHELGIGSVIGSPTDANNSAAIIVTHDFGRVDRARSKYARARSKCAKTTRKTKTTRRKKSRRKRRCAR